MTTQSHHLPGLIDRARRGEPIRLAVAGARHGLALGLLKAKALGQSDLGRAQLDAACRLLPT